MLCAGNDDARFTVVWGEGTSDRPVSVSAPFSWGLGMWMDGREEGRAGKSALLVLGIEG